MVIRSRNSKIDIQHNGQQKGQQKREANVDKILRKKLNNFIGNLV